MVALGYVLTWLTFRSFSMAILVGVALATTTFNYHVYSVPGSVVMLPLISFLLVFGYCQIAWLRTAAHSWVWGAATVVACVLFALAYEGWLDLVPLAWIVYPALAWHFRRIGDPGRSRRCLLLLGLVTSVALAYTTIKVLFGLGEWHPLGGEADLIFTYGRDHKLLMFEDILSSFITFFFTTITTYLPPELFSFSLSLWKYGPEKIVALQEGYHAQAAHLTRYNHLFLWRYYAGIRLGSIPYGILEGCQDLLQTRQCVSPRVVCTNDKYTNRQPNAPDNQVAADARSATLGLSGLPVGYRLDTASLLCRRSEM